MNRTATGSVFNAIALVMAMVMAAGCSAILPGGVDSSGHEQKRDDDDLRLVRVQNGLEWPATRGDWDAAVAERHVLCGLEDIDNHDIADVHRTMVPTDGWEQPRAGSQGRCGDDYETLLFRLTNCERRARGLEPLRCDRRLVWTGRAHSDDMRERDYFGHETPEGQRAHHRLTERGINWRAAGENIAIAPTMALAHSSWMQSRGHRNNVLNEQFDHGGIGVVRGERGYVLTALFAGGYR